MEFEEIRDVLEGKLFLSPSIARAMVELLVAAPGGDASAQASILSDREMQVFERCGTRQIVTRSEAISKLSRPIAQGERKRINVDSATELLWAAVRFHDAKEK